MRVLSEPWARLRNGQLWRLVDHQHNQFIAQQIQGERVLDLGCGYGTLVNHLNEKGCLATGLDLDASAIGAARELHPGLDFRQGELEEFETATFDHVVMKDSWHHIYEESDPVNVLSEIRRILKPCGSLVIFDPNLSIPLRICRRLVGHVDAECSVEAAQELLTLEGFRASSPRFFEAFALALSGGYVGPVIFPPIPKLQVHCVTLNKLASEWLEQTWLGPRLLWRYCLTAFPIRPWCGDR